MYPPGHPESDEKQNKWMIMISQNGPGKLISRKSSTPRHTPKLGPSAEAIISADLRT
jgi:hypothetical protein